MCIIRAIQHTHSQQKKGGKKPVIIQVTSPFPPLLLCIIETQNPTCSKSVNQKKREMKGNLTVSKLQHIYYFFFCQHNKLTISSLNRELYYSVFHIFCKFRVESLRWSCAAGRTWARRNQLICGPRDQPREPPRPVRRRTSAPDSLDRKWASSK